MAQSLKQLRRNKRVHLLEYVDAEDAYEVELSKGWTFDTWGDNRIRFEDTLVEIETAVRYLAMPFDGPYDT